VTWGNLKSVLALVVAVAGCATPQARTIEPPSNDSGKGGDDTGFVLSRRSTGAKDTRNVDLHTSEKWWPFRARFLNISEAVARGRDAEISDAQAPDGFWDEQTSVEALSLWTAVCNECHGGRRRMDDIKRMPAPTATWGRGEGLFFGARRRYGDVFAVVFRGGPERNGVQSEMPAWRSKLPKEMIWALLYFLEYQSGGIEGRFPPSLYPRRGDNE
jgi:hypothetical protein